MSKRECVNWSTLSTRHGTASWAVIDGLLHLRSCDGTKVAELGAMQPMLLAQILMRELAEGAQGCCGGWAVGMAAE